jgi:hypothetical protein
LKETEHRRIKIVLIRLGHGCPQLLVSLYIYREVL